ncbi:MAG: hypothetical protein LWX51_17155 [Deltaproteobacteria bacterium]|nr:hypothetical protein [Deltaproteobacteria bacterium]
MPNSPAGREQGGRLTRFCFPLMKMVMYSFCRRIDDGYVSAQTCLFFRSADNDPWDRTILFLYISQERKNCSMIHKNILVIIGLKHSMLKYHGVSPL